MGEPEVDEPILGISGLRVAFDTEEGRLEAVRGISFGLLPGKTLGLVGESGCGKSVTAQSIMGLLPPAGHVVGGTMRFKGAELTSASRRQLRAIRGRQIAIVFQDSMTSLNPVLTIGRQIRETVETHRGLHGEAATNRVIELLEEVGVPDPRVRAKQYPHQLSGGLRQRVAIAIALSGDPDLLIADEPTTALDVTVQAQILELLRQEQRQRAMAMILITHDLGVVARVADDICVMYAGRIVEQASAAEIFKRPAHPYTLGLLRSVPRIDRPFQRRLPSIVGSPPPLSAVPSGCAFRPRCEFAVERCEVEPPLESVAGGPHSAACWVKQGGA